MQSPRCDNAGRPPERLRRPYDVLLRIRVEQIVDVEEHGRAPALTQPKLLFEPPLRIVTLSFRQG